MTEQSSADGSRGKLFLSLPLLILALFPLLALLTYDWRAIDALCTPPLPHSNWIGALGDYFAYYGYLFVGLAIWIVPILTFSMAAAAFRGKKIALGRKSIWFAIFVGAAACTLQVIGSHGGPVEILRAQVNTPDAGGIVGYLIMTRALSALLSDFGSSIISVSVMIISLIAAVGTHAFANGFGTIINWAKGSGRGNSSNAELTEEEREALDAAARAKEEVKRQRLEEKARIKAEKAAAKEAAREAMRAAAAAKVASEQRPFAPPPGERPAASPVRQAPSQPYRAVEQASVVDEAEDKGPYLLPPLSLLNPIKKAEADHGDVQATAKRLIDTLTLFDINTTLAYTVEGPVVTKYALTPEPGTRAEKFPALQKTLELALKAKTLRIESPIPGENAIGFEVPNPTPAGISFREIIESDAWKNFSGALPLLFGRDAAGKELIADLTDMPHLLVAGATGQGKSVCLNSLICGLLMTKTPDEVKFIMVDPKSVEFAAYASIPHLVAPVIVENKKAMLSLQWAESQMEKRLKLFMRAKVRNIHGYNHRPTQTDLFGEEVAGNDADPKTLPYIVVIIDEVADLMATNGKEVTPIISRLAAKARATGIHLILATQRPDAKIITGTIKANIPGRVAFKTATAIDSRTILDSAGAENLIGRGDMLYKTKDSLLRAQGAWISDGEIQNIISFIEEHSSTQFDERFTNKLQSIKEETFDPLADDEEQEKKPSSAAEEREKARDEEEAKDFRKALECVIEARRASVSFFQRRMRWGYNHAARMLDLLEDAGVVGPAVGAGPRQIIMDEMEIRALLQNESDGGAVEGAEQIEPDMPTPEAEENISYSQETEEETI
ncbi:MAG: DNA translocase FtsK 4TM domain-containing protein [Kiritimatiellae bacterium]|nr:DNA translocase FtsK 4TM domain-containing protein [Kiritimatiellia bacterium]